VSAPPGWYPDPEGRPQCSRYFDGTAWTNHYQRCTDSGRSRWRRFAAALQWIVASVVLLGAASVFVVAGIRTIGAYRDGTPTTATIQSCHDVPHSGVQCSAEWSLDGGNSLMEGPIVGDVGGYAIGSRLDVRVNAGKAYTWSSGYTYFIMAAVPIGLLAVAALLTRWTRRRRERGTGINSAAAPPPGDRMSQREFWRYMFKGR
jgi:Protein of unknown function (DUF2510)